MAFRSRIYHYKLKHLTYQFTRYCFQFPYGPSLSHTIPHSSIGVTGKPFDLGHRLPTEFCGTVRFFAAPVQAKPKKEEKHTSGPRLNEDIDAPYVRLVTDEGHDVISRFEALKRARKLNVDLVEVQRKANPPVCKLMDFHREKYKQQIKEKERAKDKPDVTLRKGVCKEVRFTGKIEDRDLKMKADTVKRMMESGYRVKCTAMGKEDEDLLALLSRLSCLIEDVSVVESEPRRERKNAHMIVRHVKFGPMKKGGGKKVKVPENRSGENEDEILACESKLPTSAPADSLWSTSGENDDFDEIFDLGDVADKASESPNDKIGVSAVSETPTSFVASDIMRGSKPVSSPLEPSLETENRYKKNEQRNQSTQVNAMVRRPQERDMPRLENKFSEQRRERLSQMNVPPFRGEMEHAGTDAFKTRHAKGQYSDVPKQEPFSPGSPTSSGRNYGIFSTPNAVPSGKRDTIQDNEGNLYGNARKPSVNQVSNQNLNGSNTDGSQRRGNEKGGQQWGIFSREGSNAIPNRISKPG